jgi:hypothetical protein
MTIYYSPTTKGFYDGSVEYLILPSDLVEIPASDHMALVDAINNQQKEIVVDVNGDISLRDVVPVITWDNIRSRRNSLLASSDYTQMADWPGDKTAWAVYRQQLRDLPQIYTNAANVLWPTVPGA